MGRPSPHPQRPRIPPWAAGAHSRFPRRKRREKTATIRHMCLPGKRNTFCRKSRLTKAHPRSPSLFLPGPSPVCASTWHAAHSAVHRGPGWRCAPSHLAPGQGSDCQLTRQQEVGAFDDQRGRKRGLRLPSPCGGGCTPEQGPWGSGHRCWSALGSVCVTSCRWAASWEVRGWKTQSLGEATCTPADVGKNSRCCGTMNRPQRLQGR